MSATVDRDPSGTVGPDDLARLGRLARSEQVRELHERFAGRVGESLTGWAAELAALADAAGLGPAVLRTVVADLAWEARAAGLPIPQADTAGTGPGALVAAWFEGQRLRYDFRFEALDQRSRDWVRRFPGDALLLALAAFAAAGRHDPAVGELVTRAIDSPNADEKSRHVALHALHFAVHDGPYAEQLLRLADDMLARNEANSNVYYRRAGANRQLGDYDAALTDIDRAMALLPAGRNDVHQDYVRERELSLSARATTRLVAKLTAQLEDTVEERVAEAQRVVSDGLLKIIEVLGLFIALVGFVAGTGLAAIKAQSFGQLALAMALLVVGTATFFFLLRLTTQFRRRRR